MTSSFNLESVKPHILPIVAVLVVVATVPLVIMPWTTQILSDFQDISDKSALRDQLMTKASELESFDVTKSKEILQSTIEPALPAVADPAGALGTLELVAQKVDATIVGVSYNNSTSQAATPSVDAAQGAAGTTTPAEPKPSFVGATITLEASFPNLVRFISNSEIVSRVVSIDNFHLTKGDPGAEVVTASFNVSVPYLPHPSDLGPIEDPFPLLQPVDTKIIDKVKAYNRTSYSPTDVQNITGKTNPF